MIAFWLCGASDTTERAFDRPVAHPELLIYYKSLRSSVLSKHRRKMYRLAASALVTFACLTVAASQLPCDSQLRLSPSFSHLFTHCECSLSEWTDWVAISTQPVPMSQCPSGKALTEERRQRVVSGNCDEKREERVVCKYNVHGHHECMPSNEFCKS